jgi:hypothetical protein
VGLVIFHLSLRRFGFCLLGLRANDLLQVLQFLAFPFASVIRAHDKFLQSIPWFLTML